MVTSRQWVRNFSVEPEDVDYLMNLLLEKETPLSSRELAAALVEQKLNAETQAHQARYQGASVYDPSRRYDVGERIIFPQQDHAIATVSDVRPGDNEEYGAFSVISVEFPDSSAPREFAAELTVPHKLSAAYADGETPMPGAYSFSVADILEENGDAIEFQVELALDQTEGLVSVARKWFPRDLIIDVDQGVRNLAEAALEMSDGGPLPTSDILDVIGSIASVPRELEIFSLNYALNEDSRFDEVGPAGEVLWYLTSREPKEVREMPRMLRYQPLEYSRSMMTANMIALEREIDDELSNINVDELQTEGQTTLIYPHRRAGTLALNSALRDVFPTARRAPRIYVTLVDGQDGEEYTGWVVHEENYVYGLGDFYAKHRLPVGAVLKARHDERPGHIIIDYGAYRPRTEYVSIFGVKDNQPMFETIKRSVGADFDPLMIVGVEDIAAVEAFAESQQRKALPALLKMLIPPLGALSPQGAVHAKTLYSIVNVLRRCPPAPIFATLNANPDFENVGDHYWKLSDH